MIDIDARLHSASESIKVTFVDPEIILEKAKIGKNKRKVDISKILKFSFGGVGVFAAITLIMIPLLPKLGNSSGNSHDPEMAADDEPGRSYDNKESGSKDAPIYSDNLMKAKSNIKSFSDADISSGFNGLVEKINTYSSSLFEEINSHNTEKKNVSYSPASLYNALSILSKITKGNDKAKLLSFLGVTEEELDTYLPHVIEACNRTYKNSEETIGRELLDNSLWLDNNHFYDQTTLQSLADLRYTNSFWADFKNDNSAANNLMNSYVKDLSEGIVDSNFKFSKDTVSVILSNLYFTDAWESDGTLLTYVGDSTFTQYNGESKIVEYYGSFNNPGRIVQTETYQSMFAQSMNGFKIEFILPNNGINVEDLYNEETLNNHEEINYSEMGYETNIYFPSFSGGFQGNLLSAVLKAIDLNKFSNFEGFAIDKETGDDNFAISTIVHNTKVNIDSDEEIETNFDLSINESSSEKIQNFVIDRPFIYKIKDSVGITLFNGIVYKV